MTDKPDAGDIVAQTAVPILPDDTAREVFDKVTRRRRDDARPRAAGARRRHGAARAAGPRARAATSAAARPEDGMHRLEPQMPRAIHNLVRAVAPPYPGAFTDGRRRRGASPAHARASMPRHRRRSRRRCEARDGRLVAHCGGGGRSRCSRSRSTASQSTRRRSPRASARRRCRSAARPGVDAARVRRAPRRSASAPRPYGMLAPGLDGSDP